MVNAKGGRWVGARAYWREWVEACRNFGVSTRMSGCGGKVYVCENPFCHHSDGRAIVPDSCNSRLCPFCSVKHQTERLGVHTFKAKQANRAKLVTLSGPLIPYQESLVKAVKRYRKAFRALRRSEAWNKAFLGVLAERRKDGSKSQAHQDGGIYSFEITLRPGGFHLHMHILTEIPWIENRNEHGRPLEERWKKALTRAGENIDQGKRVHADVRNADRKAIREVLKYTVKGAALLEPAGDGPPAPDLFPLSTSVPKAHEDRQRSNGRKLGKKGQLRPSELPPEGLRHLVELLEGRVHLIEPFGSWRDARKKYREEMAEEAKDSNGGRRMCSSCLGEMRLVGSFGWNHSWWSDAGGNLEFNAPMDMQRKLADYTDMQSTSAWKVEPWESQSA